MALAVHLPPPCSAPCRPDIVFSPTGAVESYYGTLKGHDYATSWVWLSPGARRAAGGLPGYIRSIRSDTFWDLTSVRTLYSDADSAIVYYTLERVDEGAPELRCASWAGVWTVVVVGDRWGLDHQRTWQIPWGGNEPPIKVTFDQSPRAEYPPTCPPEGWWLSPWPRGTVAGGEILAH